MIIEEQLQVNITLAPFTTFGIGGPADYFIRATSTELLVQAVRWARGKGIPVFILGRGANILVGDKGFRGLVIKNETKKVKETKGPKETEEPKEYITAESGAIIGDLINEMAKKGLSGLEHYAGIPSTVGGAIWQNLHFLSPDRKSTVFIADIVTSATILNKENEIQTVDKNYFHFGYDWSEIHETHDVVLDVTLQLTPDSREMVYFRMNANLQWRNEKHPEEAHVKSAGSIFKVIKGFGAGRLIDAAGLKGKRVGGAEISPTHANFIMNVDHATAKDVRDLISLVQEKVKEVNGLSLEPEITFVGDF